MRRALLALTALAVVPLAMAVPSQAASTGFVPPKAGHVWVIELENKSFDAAFVKNTNTYLWSTLPKMGVLLRQYYGTGHLSLDNYIAELSGQAPTAVTQADCQRYQDVLPGVASPLAGGQVVGQGCVYPAAVKTLPDQLTAKGLRWRGYMQDMGLDPAREEATCGRPVAGGIPVDPAGPGGADGTQSASAKDQYAARHNPFLYFHSVTDNVTSCRAHVVPLVHQKTGAAAGSTDLLTDLKTVATTPSFSFVTPNLCDDAHDATCVGKNTGGTTQGGLFAADLFLKKWIPAIQASPAYKKDGVIIVTIDESGDVGTAAGATACCGEPTGPNTPLPGIAGPGGGRIGTIVISDRFTTPGTVSDAPYNHYSMLRSMEDLFRLGATPAIPGSDGKGHLGYAGQAGLVPFGKDVYSRAADAPTVTRPTASPGASNPGRPITGTATRGGGPTTGTATGGGAAPTSTSRAGTGRLATTGPRAVLPAVALLALGGSLMLRRRRRATT